MSDTNQSSGLTNRTQAELESAQQAEAQLQQERERLQAIANAYRECEARLQLTREQIEQLISDSIATNAPPAAASVTNPTNDAAVQNIFDLLNQLATDPFTLVKPANQDTSASAPQNNHGPVAAPGPQPSDTPADTFFPPGGTDIVPFETGANTDSPALQIPPRTPGQTNFVPQVNPPTSATGQDFSAGADLQAQALQASGERLRSALEQNTQITASLFDQMLTLMGSQNRKLGQVDQKISELSGQLQSLKNP